MGDAAYIDPLNGHKYIFDAWLWFRVARQRCIPGGGHPLGLPSYPINMEDYRTANSLNDLIDEENQLCLDAPRVQNPYLAHTCASQGCHSGCKSDALPGYEDEGEVYDVVVVDGVQTLSGIACGNVGCTNPPARNKRFCQDHRDLENICAAHVGPGGNDYCMEPVQDGRQTCVAHSEIEDLYGGDLPPTYMRARRANEEQHEWRADHNEYWRERKKHRYYVLCNLLLLLIIIGFEPSFCGFVIIMMCDCIDDVQQRFTRAMLKGYWFLLRPCGMILACLPMVNHEAATDLVEWLDQLFTIDNMPRYVIYDRACQVMNAQTNDSGVYLR